MTIKRLTFFFIFFGALATVFIFQNCGKSKSNSPAAPNTSTGGGTGGGGTGTGGTNFAKGELFSYSSLPDELRTQMFQVQLTELNYMSSSTVKAIAVAANGQGFVRRAGYTGMTQEEMNKAVLEACFVISGGKPCSLLVVGNYFNVSRNDLNNSYTFTMTKPTTISGTTIPFVRTSLATTIATNYLAAASPKALVVGLDGSWFIAANTVQAPVSNLQDATRVAMQRCELSTSVVPCTLFATDNTIIFDPLVINRLPVIDYSVTTLTEVIPGIKLGTFTNAIKNDYLSKVNGTSTYGAVYITPDGAASYSYASSASKANADALAGCKQNEQPAFPCFKYATNTAVEPLTPNLTAIKYYSLSLHCNTVPRETCAAHLAVGCPAGGSYYTINAGLIALETCN